MRQQTINIKKTGSEVNTWSQTATLTFAAANKAQLVVHVVSGTSSKLIATKDYGFTAPSTLVFNYSILASLEVGNNTIIVTSETPVVKTTIPNLATATAAEFNAAYERDYDQKQELYAGLKQSLQLNAAQSLGGPIPNIAGDKILGLQEKNGVVTPFTVDAADITKASTFAKQADTSAKAAVASVGAAQAAASSASSSEVTAKDSAAKAKVTLADVQTAGNHELASLKTVSTKGLSDIQTAAASGLQDIQDAEAAGTTSIQSILTAGTNTIIQDTDNGKKALDAISQQYAIDAKTAIDKGTTDLTNLAANKESAIESAGEDSINRLRDIADVFIGYGGLLNLQRGLQISLEITGANIEAKFPATPTGGSLTVLFNKVKGTSTEAVTLPASLLTPLVTDANFKYVYVNYTKPATFTLTVEDRFYNYQSCLDKFLVGYVRAGVVYECWGVAQSMSPPIGASMSLIYDVKNVMLTKGTGAADVDISDFTIHSLYNINKGAVDWFTKNYAAQKSITFTEAYDDAGSYKLFNDISAIEAKYMDGNVLTKVGNTEAVALRVGVDINGNFAIIYDSKKYSGLQAVSNAENRARSLTHLRSDLGVQYGIIGSIVVTGDLSEFKFPEFDLYQGASPGVSTIVKSTDFVQTSKNGVLIQDGADFKSAGGAADTIPIMGSDSKIHMGKVGSGSLLPNSVQTDTVADASITDKKLDPSVMLEIKYISTLDTAVSGLENAMTGALTAVSDATNIIQTLDAEITQLQNQAAAANGVDAAAQALIDANTKAVAAYNTQAAGFKADLAKLQANPTPSAQEQQEIARLQALIDANTKAVAAHNTQAAGFRADLAKLRANPTPSAQELQEIARLQALINTNTKEVTAFNTQAAGFKTDLAKLQANPTPSAQELQEIAKLQARIKTVEALAGATTAKTMSTAPTLSSPNSASTLLRQLIDAQTDIQTIKSWQDTLTAAIPEADADIIKDQDAMAAAQASHSAVTGWTPAEEQAFQQHMASFAKLIQADKDYKQKLTVGITKAQADYTKAEAAAAAIQAKITAAQAAAAAKALTTATQAAKASANKVIVGAQGYRADIEDMMISGSHIHLDHKLGTSDMLVQVLNVQAYTTPSNKGYYSAAFTYSIPDDDSIDIYLWDRRSPASSDPMYELKNATKPHTASGTNTGGGLAPLPGGGAGAVTTGAPVYSGVRVLLMPMTQGNVTAVINRYVPPAFTGNMVSASRSIDHFLQHTDTCLRISGELPIKPLAPDPFSYKVSMTPGARDNHKDSAVVCFISNRCTYIVVWGTDIGDTDASKLQVFFLQGSYFKADKQNGSLIEVALPTDLTRQATVDSILHTMLSAGTLFGEYPEWYSPKSVFSPQPDSGLYFSQVSDALNIWDISGGVSITAVKGDVYSSTSYAIDSINIPWVV